MENNADNQQAEGKTTRPRPVDWILIAAVVCWGFSAVVYAFHMLACYEDSTDVCPVFTSIMEVFLVWCTSALITYGAVDTTPVSRQLRKRGREYKGLIPIIRVTQFLPVIFPFILSAETYMKDFWIYITLLGHVLITLLKYSPSNFYGILLCYIAGTVCTLFQGFRPKEPQPYKVIVCCSSLVTVFLCRVYVSLLINRREKDQTQPSDADADHA